MSDEKTSDVNEYQYGSPDLIVPDIPMPTPPKPREEIQDKIEGAFRFAFIGAGQGGSRIAEIFHKLGYRKVAVINTAQQDLNTIKVDNKLCIGDGGAGKDPDVARKKYEERKEDVLDFIRDNLGEGIDRYFVCVGAGGGTGAGTLMPLVETASNLQKLQKASTEKVGVILALPKISEGTKVNANAYRVLEEAYAAVEKGLVSPLVVVDNEKINKLYPGLGVAQFWQTANMSIAGLFHLFNNTATKDSSYSAFDTNDYKQVLDSGMIVFGATQIAKWDGPSDISQAVRDNLKSNVLSGGVDLSTGTSAGVIMIGGNEVLANVPQEHLDRAFEQFTRMLADGGIVHRGIYSGNKDNLTAYTMIGGLGRPSEKLEELRRIGNIK